MKVFTLLPHSTKEQEVEIELFFKHGAKRYAVIYTQDDSGECHFHVRLEEHLRFIEETAADAA